MSRHLDLESRTGSGAGEPPAERGELKRKACFRGQERCSKMIECVENQVIQEDIESIVESGIPVEQLRGKTVFITGATGLIGSQMVYLLACYNRKADMNIRIVAMVRNREKAVGLLSHLIERGDVEIYVGDVNQPILYEGKVDYVIHGASPTSSQYFVSHPVETIRTAIDGTTHILDLAVQNQITGMVYLSSLEVYGVPQKEEGTISEDDYGYIDPLSVRSSYSEGKRMVECMCASYAKEYQVPVKIARLSQTFGPGVNYNDGRVFAEFARCAIEKRDIVLHTQGNTVRTYCYTKDALAAILYILLKGETGEAYNVTNMDTSISIREMAELVSNTIGKGLMRTVIDISDDVAGFGYNPEMVIRLDSRKLESLGWHTDVDLKTMYVRMCEDMRQKRQESV